MTRRKDPETEAPEAKPMGEAMASAETVETPPPLSPPSSAPQAAPPPKPRRSGVLGPVLGGALAATGGFGLAHFDVFDLRADLAPDQSAEIAALKDQMTRLSDAAGSIATLSQRLEALDTRLAALESRPAPEAPDLSGLQALEDRLAAIEALPEGDAASTAALASRLARIETALQSMPATDTTALQADLDAAMARLATAEAEALARAEEARTAAAAALRDQALRALTDAVTAGRPFGTELSIMSDPALAAALGPMAETGAPTLEALRASFPEAARETLRLAREISAEDGWSDRLWDFLAVQTEARSLTPRDGTDPDAILSRAEFALADGRVADALAELSGLDPALSAPLDAWTQDANRHLSAMAALAAAGGE